MMYGLGKLMHSPNNKKKQATVSLLSLDLYLNWYERIARHDGFVDNVLKTAALAPIAITVAQSVYFLPRFNKLLEGPSCLYHFGYSQDLCISCCWSSFRLDVEKLIYR